MAALSSSDLLAAWDAGRARRPLDRALWLLWATGTDAAQDLPLADRDRRLLRLREALFGRQIALLATCPGCAAQVEISVDTQDLQRHLGDCGEVMVETPDGPVTLRAMTSADLAQISSVPEDEREAAACDRLTPAHPAAARTAIYNAIEAQLAEAELTVRLVCTDCGTSWRETLDIADCLWVEVDTAARRLMADVADLAGAFGWSEAQSLAVPAARRAVYLAHARGI